MDPLSVTASIITIVDASTKLVGYLNKIKDAPQDRVRCAAEILSLCSLLFNLRDHIEKNDSTKWYSTVQSLAIENGPLDQFKQALETLHSKIADGGRLKKVGEALMWKFQKEEIASILGQIERLKTLVEIALQLDHLKLSQAIKDNTESIKDNIGTVQTLLDDAEHRRLLEWISPTNYPSQQSDIIARRQEGTFEWFWKAPEVENWLSKSKQTLFCPGIPGVGKTMVAAIAIDRLLNNSSHGVAYVFCNYKSQVEQKEQDAYGMLSAILKQLMQAQPPTLSTVEKLYRKHADRGTKLSLDEISSALQNILLHFPTTYIVIDALDECQDQGNIRRQFLPKLRNLQAVRDVRLLVTSRLIPEIEDAFQDALRLEVQASKDDIELFVAGQMDRLPSCVQGNTTLQKNVRDKIVKASDGMFLLARLHIESLLDKRTVKAINLTLNRLSSSSAALENAYRDALQRIEAQLPGDRGLAKNALSWIVFAKRRLTITEICCALAVELGEPELDPENVPNARDVVSVCAGLVVIDSESAIIRLVHYTAQEFFEQTRDTRIPGAQLYVASICITYLSFNKFKTGGCSSDEEFEERLQRSKFLDYAAKYWGKHVKPVESEVCELARSFLLNSHLVLCATQVMSVSRYRYQGYCLRYPESTTGLHLTAHFGLSIILQAILPSEIREIETVVDAMDSTIHGKSPLFIAAERGQKEVAKLLLRRGADPHDRCRAHQSKFQAASSRGHENIVRLLLDARGDVNMWSEEYGNALYVASANGYKQTAELLLDEGANPNAQFGGYSNVLHGASKRGHGEVVELLLNKGANPNAQCGMDGSALSVASFMGHEKIVELLLNAGAKVNTQGGMYGSALCAASVNGREWIVGLLLANGADINAQGGIHCNALEAASYGGYTQVMKLLLEKGVNINAQGLEGNALQEASERGDGQMVQLLLSKGANPNSLHVIYGSPLKAASERGHKQIVELLLNNGANVYEYYGNALEPAIRNGYEQIVELLINNQAHPDVPDEIFIKALKDASEKGHEQIVKSLLSKEGAPGRFDKALFEASRNGHLQIVQLLLDNGANVNAQDGYCGSALQVASNAGCKDDIVRLFGKRADVNARGGVDDSALDVASRNGYHQIVKLLLENSTEVAIKGGGYGHAPQATSCGSYTQIVKLLLDNGAEVNAQGGRYGNALCAASRSGCEEIVKLLLAKGADVNIQGRMYGNALQAASHGSYPHIVKLLLENGADVNIQGGKYGNALQAASECGDTQVITLLLNKGAEVNAQGGELANALYAASLEGHEETVKLLLANGADINAQGGTCGNAICASSFVGHEQIVKRLLDEGADANALSGRFANALQAASSMGDILQDDTFKGHTLEAHLLERNKRIREMLLDRGAVPSQAATGIV